MRRVILGLGLLACAASAEAQMGGMEGKAPACAAPAPPPPQMAGWATPAPLRAGADAALAPTLVPGKAAAVALLPTSDVHYPLHPEKPAAQGSHGGVLALDVARAGTYRVAIGSGAWLDVVGKDGAGVISTAHGRGPDCTGIRKMVDFPLTPGRYTVQISGSAAAQITAMVLEIR